MDIKAAGKATRNTIAVNLKGSESFSLPKPFFERPILVLKPGMNIIPADYFHALGAYPSMVEAIASGQIEPVCPGHEFPSDPREGLHCFYCGHSPQSAAAQEPATVTP